MKRCNVFQGFTNFTNSGSKPKPCLSPVPTPRFVKPINWHPNDFFFFWKPRWYLFFRVHRGKLKSLDPSEHTATLGIMQWFKQMYINMFMCMKRLCYCNITIWKILKSPEDGAEIKYRKLCLCTGAQESRIK